jgi:DNA modification methylase
MENTDWKNQLYYGDNLEVMREEIPAESVDLVYLDPPFNSKANYNILFKDKAGDESEAQIEAFGDTWHWDRTTPFIHHQLITNADYPQLANLMGTLIDFLGRNDMMAYLVMMAIRLVELHRVLKPTGSIYLHCDPTASHYLKLVMDAIFGAKNFQNEIIWHYRRWTAGAKRYQRMHDIIFWYAKSRDFHFDIPYEPYGDWIKKDYGHIDEETGKRWRWHTVKGVRYKVYLDDINKGVKCNDVWLIPFIGSTAKERMGYPTQKPEALLERIIKASSNEGDVILDPFCGCGTTVAVSEKLNRRWIGIDITHLAINLIEKRMKDKFKDKLLPYEIFGTPKSMSGAYELAKRDKYQFEWWALSLVNARPYGGKKKGADGGIDGIMYFSDDDTGKHKEIIVQVKGGSVGSAQVDALIGNITNRKSAEIGIFITLKPPTKPMLKKAEELGLYTSEITGKQYRRMQILTIEELFDGKKPDYPFRDSGGFSPYTKATRNTDSKDNKLYK